MDPAEAFVAAPTAAADWVVILPVAVPLAGAALLVILRSGRDFHAGFSMLITAATLYADFELLSRIAEFGPRSMTMGRWLPPFGISFTADVMGAVFATIASVVTLAVLVYSEGEHREPHGKSGFHAFVLLLLAGVGGAFLTGDLFNLYVWFEVMLIASLGLLVSGARPAQLDATVKYGILNLVGTSLFLLGVGLLYGLLGTLNMADIVRSASRADSAPLATIGAVFLLAFGIKAAAVPVNGWLPASYHTPPVAVSALLAALLTKVGIYALLRVMGLLLPVTRDFLAPVLVIAAVATMLLGALGAIAETNLRRSLGFILIGGIGVTLSGLALGTAEGLVGSIVYVVHAMLTMAALYLVAGLIEARTGADDTRRMGGLYAANSLLGLLFLVLLLAGAGVPPLLGFWPKLALLQAALGDVRAPQIGWDGLLIAAALVANAFLTLFAGARLWSHIFWRPGHEGSGSELANPGLRSLPRRQLWLGTGAATALTLIVVVAGLWPEPLLSAAARAAVGLVDPAQYVEAVGLGGVP